MTPAVNLGKHLKKIIVLTEQFINDSAYDLGSSGGLRNYYQQQRGARKRTRLKSAITRNINSAKRNAVDLSDKSLIVLIDAIESVTRQVVNHCSYFPKAEEWPGQQLVDLQISYIGDAKRIIEPMKAVK